MKKIILSIATCLAFLPMMQATVYFTKTGSINFLSKKESVDKVEANSKAVVCKLDSETGALDFVVLIKSFVFANQLMQEHFNENYMESDKFPKATFKGKLDNLKDINFSKNGIYKTNVTGSLLIHGVTKNISIAGTVTIKDGTVTLTSDFAVALADYKIDIPGAVKDKISKNINIAVNCKLATK